MSSASDSRKIKLIVSDFHVGMGVRLPDGRANPLEEFLETDRFLELVRFYSTGPFADHDVELVINGDFLDLLHDPLSPPTDQITEDLCLERVGRILEGHRKLFDGLAAFCALPGKRLSLVVGNHDQGLLWESVQEVLRRRIGPAVAFHADAYAFDGVYVAHGHQFEFIHHYNPRRFTYINPEGRETLRLTWGSYFVLHVVSKGRRRRPYMDRVRPFRKYLRWALFNDFFFFWRMIGTLVVFWVTNRLHRDPDRRREFRFSPVRIYNAVTHRPLPKLAERILANTRYRVVVFGHSHHADHRDFGPIGQYFNTGTWTEVIDLELPRFGPRRNLTYALVEYEGDAPRARLLQWLGQSRVYEEIA